MHAAARMTPRTSRNTGGGAYQMAASMPAVITRPLRQPSHLAPRPRVTRLDAAVAAVPLLVVDHRFEQVAAPEIRPQHVGDVDLRVRDLPEQEVADAHLAARADEQVGIGLAGGVEQVAEPLLVEAAGSRPISMARRAASTISARPL